MYFLRVSGSGIISSFTCGQGGRERGGHLGEAVLEVDRAALEVLERSQQLVTVPGRTYRG